jgi:hypothetical protein
LYGIERVPPARNRKGKWVLHALSETAEETMPGFGKLVEHLTFVKGGVE